MSSGRGVFRTYSENALIPAADLRLLAGRRCVGIGSPWTRVSAPCGRRPGGAVRSIRILSQLVAGDTEWTGHADGGCGHRTFEHCESPSFGLEPPSCAGRCAPVGALRFSEPETYFYRNTIAVGGTQKHQAPVPIVLCPNSSAVNLSGASTPASSADTLAVRRVS